VPLTRRPRICQAERRRVSTMLWRFYCLGCPVGNPLGLSRSHVNAVCTPRPRVRNENVSCPNASATWQPWPAIIK